MYPYVDVLSKEAFDLIDENILKENNLDYEIVDKDELTDKLFNHVSVIQAHIIETFQTDGLAIDDIIVAEINVDELPDYKDITVLLNESFEIIGIPFKYNLKAFVPKDIEIKPRRYEYVFVNVPLVFSMSIFLYKAASTFIEQSDVNKIVLLKANSDEYD